VYRFALGIHGLNACEPVKVVVETDRGQPSFTRDAAVAPARHRSMSLEVYSYYVPRPPCLLRPLAVGADELDAGLLQGCDQLLSRLRPPSSPRGLSGRRVARHERLRRAVLGIDKDDVGRLTPRRVDR
jgi:hypothetical protein